MGWIYHMDFHLAEDLPATLRELKASGVRLYVAESEHEAAVAPHQPLGDRRWALAVGNEESGVSAEVVRLGDELVGVPVHGGESMNVAHATAICLYELGKGMARPKEVEPS